MYVSYPRCIFYCDLDLTPKAWFPPGDTFLEIEIKTIATFIPRRQRHFQGDIFISPNKFLSTHSNQIDIITKHQALLMGSAAAPNKSTSFNFVRRLESNFLKLFAIVYYYFTIFQVQFLGCFFPSSLFYFFFFEIFFLFVLQTGIHLYKF